MNVTLTEEELNLVHELRAVRDAGKSLKAREDELRAAILQRLDGAEEALTGSGAVAVKVTTQTRRNIDRAKLEALFPDVFDSVVSESVVTIVKLP